MGSIPAGAGEPYSAEASPPRPQVYPRRCGGTSTSVSLDRPSAGLSPQVRGNRGLLGLGVAQLRSIPAGAGEPASACWSRSCWRVYPRRCGGTLRAGAVRAAAPGLSPQVRGNRRRDRGDEQGSGSIPAGAGEPSVNEAVNRMVQVYPRRCGGTTTSSGRVASTAGLSPQVRGNPRRRGHPQSRGRSIPAGAGEPRRSPPRCASSWVYPRRCGGTGLARIAAWAWLGLSPQVRGNPHPAPLRRADRGSIPAGAGEPRRRRWQRGRVRVYPRRCGGTGPDQRRRRGHAGLSPQVRGNPQPVRARA